MNIWKYILEIMPLPSEIENNDIVVDNAQGVPKILIGDDIRIYICEDGAILQHSYRGLFGKKLKSLGIRKGCRKKREQTDFMELPITDHIVI